MNQPIDAQTLGDLMDDEHGGLPVSSLRASLDLEEIRQEVLRLLDHLRYQRTVMDQIFRLTNPRSITPLADMQSIRVRAQAALAALDKLEDLK